MLFNAFQPGLYSVDIAGFDVAARPPAKDAGAAPEDRQLSATHGRVFCTRFNLNLFIPKRLLCKYQVRPCGPKGGYSGRFKDRFEIVKLIKCIYQFTCGDMLLNAF